MPAVHALLFTDVVDSTKLSETLGDLAMVELGAAHDHFAPVRSLLIARGGGSRVRAERLAVMMATPAEVEDRIGPL